MKADRGGQVVFTVVFVLLCLFQTVQLTSCCAKLFDFYLFGLSLTNRSAGAKADAVCTPPPAQCFAIDFWQRQIDVCIRIFGMLFPFNYVLLLLFHKHNITTFDTSWKFMLHIIYGGCIHLLHFIIFVVASALFFGGVGY